MSDGFKFNYNETEQAIANIARETSNLIQEVEEISKIINTTFTDYMNKEKTRLSEHADDEGANAGKADVLDK